MAIIGSYRGVPISGGSDAFVAAQVASINAGSSGSSGAGSSGSGGGGSSVRMETRNGIPGYVTGNQWTNAAFASPDLINAFQTGGTINSESLRGGSVPTLPAYPDLSPNFDSFISGVRAANQSLTPGQVSDENPDQLFFDAQKQILDSMRASETAAIDRIDQVRNDLQLPQVMQQIREINSQIASRDAAYQQGDLALRDQTIAMPIIGRQQRVLQEQRAIEIGKLSAQAQALQGYYDLARQTLSDTIEMERMRINANADYNKSLLAVVQKIGDRKEQRLAEERAREWDMTKMKYNELADLKKNALLNTNDPQKLVAISNADSIEDLAAIGVSLKDPREVLALENASLQNQRLRQEIEGTNNIGESSDLIAYAAQYADTGKLPSPSELKLAGLSVGQVTEVAKQLPKPKGALVSKNTGTKSSALSPTEEAGIIALNEIVNQTLPSLKDRFGKISPGILGRVGAVLYTTQDRQDYRTFRQEFLSKLLVARSGAAVTEQEYERYAALVPSELGNAFLGGLSNKGGKTLNSLEQSMKTTLDNNLNSKQLSIYGYSKVNVNGVERTVGEVLDIGGQKYRVLPDGNLTDII
jgi:hypothetical protein